jgi:hypothetical protein
VLGQVFLDETRAQMDVDLDQRIIANAAEAVDLSRLDDKDIAGAGLELLSVHGPETAAFPDELNFIVRMAVGTRATAWQRSQKENGDVYAPVVCADELVGAALEREVLLSDSVHPSGNPTAARSALPGM